jgi:hypothetical protein
MEVINHTPFSLHLAPNSLDPIRTRLAIATDDDVMQAVTSCLKNPRHRFLLRRDTRSTKIIQKPGVQKEYENKEYQKESQQLQWKEQEKDEDRVKDGQMRLNKTYITGIKKQASNCHRSSKMEEDCTGKQDRQRTVALEKKNYSN